MPIIDGGGMVFGWGLRHNAKNIGIDIPRVFDTVDMGVEKLRSLTRSRAQVFQMAYATRAWGSTESGSGTGSELAATENVSAYLPELFQRLQVSKFLARIMQRFDGYGALGA